MGTLSEPGPGALPFGLGLVFVLLSSILLFRSFRVKELEYEKRLAFGPRWRKVFLVILFLGLITFFIESLGYLLSVFLMITLSMLHHGAKKMGLRPPSRHHLFVLLLCAF